jgi:hypothetical protein
MPIMSVLLYVYDIVHLAGCNRWIYWSEKHRVNNIKVTDVQQAKMINNYKNAK